MNASPLAALTPGQDPACGDCHGAEEVELAASVHSASGVTCTDCHGTAVLAPDGRGHVPGPDFQGVPRGTQIPELCGRCHSDIERMRGYRVPTEQLALYRTSGHGRRLYENGDTEVATCASCHGAHEIRRVRDPRSPAYRTNVPETCARCHSNGELMSRYGLPGDTLEHYRNGVHGKRLLEDRELSAPSCADCHGAHGAVPPGAKDVHDVCGRCHIAVQSYFMESPHYAAAQAGRMRECTSCHGNHENLQPRLEMLAGDEPGHCGACHAPGDPGHAAARRIMVRVQDLQTRLRNLRTTLSRAREDGLFVDEERGYLRDAETALLAVVPESHTVSVSRIEDRVRDGVAAVEVCLESLGIKQRRLRDRRILTAVACGFLVLFSALLLVQFRRAARGRAPP